MRNLVHELWPLVAVVALTLILALQIPRKALLFRPAPVSPNAPYASFVAYSPEAYARLMQRVRMSWQVRSQGVDPGAGSRVDELGFDEPPPPRAELALPASFSAPPPVSHASAVSAVPLLPPSVADAAPPTALPTPPDDGAEARALRAELTDLPQSLKE